MAQAQIATGSSFSLLNATAAARTIRVWALPATSSKVSGISSPFKLGSPLSLRVNSRKRTPQCQAYLYSIRCEQGTKESSGLDVWLGRLAMLGFATAITIEITTGKGLLENFGFTTPVPTLALAVTALVGVLTAFFIFQSASQD